MTVSAFPKGTTFARMVIAKAIGQNNNAEAAGFAAARWGEASAPARLLKAAVSAGSTGDPDFGPLSGEYGSAATEFIALVRQRSIIGRLSGLRRVPLHVPILLQTGGIEGSWVKEGRPIPLSKMVFERTTMDVLKIAAMTVITEELLTTSDPAAEQLIRADLVRALAEGSDGAFIDPANAGVPEEQPASVTHGLTAITSTGDFKSDLDRLVAGFPGDLSAAFLVGKPELLVQISGAEFPNVGARGGEIAGIPTLASEGVPNAGGQYQLALIDPTGIVYTADDAAADVRVSRQGTIEMSDTPTNDGVTGAGSNQVSLWQNNCVAVAGLMRENWRVERPGSVRLLAGIAPTVAP